MTELTTKDLLLKEIEIVYSEIARFDGNGIKIKGWSLAVWAGLIAYGVQHSNVFIVLGALITTFFFACIELVYRRYQKRFILRSADIEEMLASKDLRDLSGYKYSVHSAATGKLRDRDLWTVFKEFPQFYLFYIALM